MCSRAAIPESEPRSNDFTGGAHCRPSLSISANTKSCGSLTPALRVGTAGDACSSTSIKRNRRDRDDLACRVDYFLLLKPAGSGSAFALFFFHLVVSFAAVVISRHRVFMLRHLSVQDLSAVWLHVRIFDNRRSEEDDQVRLFTSLAFLAERVAESWNITEERNLRVGLLGGIAHKTAHDQRISARHHDRSFDTAAREHVRFVDLASHNFAARRVIWNNAGDFRTDAHGDVRAGDP